MSEIPKAIWSNSFTIMGVEVKCHVLDNGKRVIDADSVEAFFAALASRAMTPADNVDLDSFIRWQAGLDVQ